MPVRSFCDFAMVAAFVIALVVLGLAGGLARPAQAEDSAAGLSRALAAETAREGDDSPHLLPVLGRLAQVRFRNGDLPEATRLRRRALAVAITAFGGESPEAATAMTALARVYIDRRRYLDAEPMLIAAEGILRDRSGADPAVGVAVFAALAEIAVARGEPEIGARWAEQALALGAQNPDVPSSAALRALATARAHQRRFEEGRRLLREALAQGREAGGENDGATARSLAALANLCLREERFAEALPLIAKATAIDQSRLGPKHPFIADDFYDLGLIYRGLNRPTMARRAITFAVALIKRGGGRATPRMAYAETELARLLREAGESAAADAAFADAKRILDAVQEEEHRRQRRV